jgi:hypothetical protein
LAAVLALGACGGGQKKKAKKKTSTSLPADYQSWPQINAETILRHEHADDEEGEVTSSTAVELYAKIEGDLGKGTTLVKTTASVDGDVVGDVGLIGVMRRIGGEENGGWQFEAYDAKSKGKADANVAACINCHSFKSDNDFLHSNRDDVLNASPRDAAAEPAGDEAAEEAPAEESAP